MLYPKVVGQSGTAIPASVVVTRPPTQISGNVRQTTSQETRLGQRLGSPCWLTGSSISSTRIVIHSLPFSTFPAISGRECHLFLRLLHKVNGDHRQTVPLLPEVVGSVGNGRYPSGERYSSEPRYTIGWASKFP